MTATRPTSADPLPVPLESTDPVATAAAEVIGGPLGRFAGMARRGWAGAASVLIALASVMVALGVAQKSHCIDKGWTAPGMYWRACFSDLPLEYAGTGLRNGTPPYLGTTAAKPPLEEPALNGALMWLVSLVTPGGSMHGQQVWYFGIWACLGMVFLGVAVAAAAWARPRSAWRASHLALSPVLVTAGLLSPDLFGVMLVTLGCAAWLRGRYVWSGIALGLSLLTGVYPALVLAGVFMVAVRNDRFAEGLNVLAIALTTAFVAALPFVLLGPPGKETSFGLHTTNLMSAYDLWAQQGAGYGSLWRALFPFMTTPVGQAQPMTPGSLTLIGWLGLVWALLIGAILTFGLRRRVGVGPVVLAMIATAMVTGKALPVQQALWLLPFIALSAIPWRDHLIWAGTEILHFVAVWMHIPASSAADKALDSTWYGIFSVLRLAGVVYLAVSAVRHHEEEPGVVGPPAITAEKDPHAEFLDSAPRGFGTA